MSALSVRAAAPDCTRPAQAIAASAGARGVAALHSFEYEDANEAFAAGAAPRSRPGHGLLGRGDDLPPDALAQRERGRRARSADAGSAPTAARALRQGQRPREQGYCSRPWIAVRRRGRRRAPPALRGRDGAAATQRYPDDPDVASFYALALLGTMSRGLIGTADAHEGHSAALAGSDTQAQVADDSRPRAPRAPRSPRRAALPAAQRRRSRARASAA